MVALLAVAGAGHSTGLRADDPGLPRCSRFERVDRFVCRVAQLQYKLNAPFQETGSKPRAMKLRKYDRRVARLLEDYRALNAQSLRPEEVSKVQPARERLRTGCRWVFYPEDVAIDCIGGCHPPRGAFCGAP